MCSSSLLQQGLETRLNSNLKLKKKLHLAVNTIQATKLGIPNKEHIIVNWFIRIIQQKLSDGTDKTTELSSVWAGFLTCLRKIHTQDRCVSFNIEFLLALANIDEFSVDISDCVQILLWLVYKQNPDSPLLINTIILFLDKLTSPSAQVSLINLMEKLSTKFQPGDVSGFGKLIAKLSLNQSVSTNGSLHKLMRKAFLFNLEELQQFLTDSSGGTEDAHAEKLQPFVDFVLAEGNIGLLISCLRSHGGMGVLNRLEAHLVCLGLHLHGYPTYSNQHWLIKRLAKRDFTSTQPCLHSIQLLLEQTLPVDTSVVVNGLSLGQQLTGLLRLCVESYGLTPGVANDVDRNDGVGCIVTIIDSVFRAHPMCLEPLVTPILAAYLGNACAPRSILEIMVSLVIRLRQLPKMVSRLMLHLRSHDSAIVTWGKEDLALLADSIEKVPRVQSIEIWKTLVYHISTDSLPNLGKQSGQLMWRAAAPLLTCVLNSAQLADHNMPAPLASRVRGLIHDTLKLVGEEESFKTGTDDHLIHADFSCSLVRLADLITHYRGEEFAGVAQLKDTLIAKAIERQQMVGYANLIIEAVCTGSHHADRIWKTFRNELINNRDYFAQIHQWLPTCYLAEVEDNILECDVVQSSERYAAYVLQTALTRLSDALPQLRKCGVDSAEWCLRPDSWRALNSDLGVGLQRWLIDLVDKGGVGDEQLSISLVDQLVSRLSCLCVETLPKVLRLVCTFICLCCLSSTSHRSNHSAGGADALYELFGRCLEETDLFRYVDAAKVAVIILDSCPTLIPTFLLEGLAREIVKYQKILSEMVQSFQLFTERIGKGEKPCMELIVYLVEHLTKPAVDAGMTREKKEIVEKLTNLVSKCVMKNAKNEEMLLGSTLLIRAATAMAFIYYHPRWVGNTAQTFSVKLEKFITKILDSCLVKWDDKAENRPTDTLRLVNRILESERGHHLLSQDHKLLARQIALGNVDNPESENFVSLMLISSADDLDTLEELVSYDEIVTLPLIANAMLSSRLPIDVKLKLKPTIEQVMFRLIADPAVDHSVKCDYLVKLMAATPPMVSSSVETAGLASLLLAEPGTDSRCVDNLLAVVKFVRYRPHLCSRQIPLLCAAVRRHLVLLGYGQGTHQDEASSMQADVGTGLAHQHQLDICVALQQLVESVKRRKQDWGNVAPYLMADVLQTYLCLADDGGENSSRCRQVLSACLNLLLDVCEPHSYDYLAANLPEASNHMFKQLLKDYKANYKFTGKST